MSNVVRIYKDGEIQQIEKKNLNRFLEEGWSTSTDGSYVSKKKSPASQSTRNKVSASAQVTKVSESEEVIVRDVTLEDFDFNINEEEK